MRIIIHRISKHITNCSRGFIMYHSYCSSISIILCGYIKFVSSSLHWRKESIQLTSQFNKTKTTTRNPSLIGGWHNHEGQWIIGFGSRLEISVEVREGNLFDCHLHFLVAKLPGMWIYRIESGSPNDNKFAILRKLL